MTEFNETPHTLSVWIDYIETVILFLGFDLENEILRPKLGCPEPVAGLYAQRYGKNSEIKIFKKVLNHRETYSRVSLAQN